MELVPGDTGLGHHVRAMLPDGELEELVRAAISERSILNHYCLNECPIGCRHSLSDEVVGIDRVTVKLLKSLKTEKLGDVKDTLLDIAADGKITEDEKPALQEVLTYLDDLAKTVSELKTIGEMALHEDGDAHGTK